MYRRRLQDRCVQVTIGRQRRDEILIEIGGHLRGLREHVRRRADHRNLLS